MSRRGMPDEARQQPRLADERFKTFDSVSRALSALADREGMSKQELIHNICSEFVAREIHAANMLLEAVECEGSAGNGRD